MVTMFSVGWDHITTFEMKVRAVRVCLRYVTPRANKSRPGKLLPPGWDDIYKLYPPPSIPGIVFPYSW